MSMQNAAPDGPAAFMFAEIVSRPLRWADDSWAHADRLSLHKTCMYADQDAYYDVLADVVSGYMLFPKSWYCLDEVCPSSLLCRTACLMRKHMTWCNLIVQHCQHASNVGSFIFSFIAFYTLLGLGPNTIN